MSNTTRRAFTRTTAATFAAFTMPTWAQDAWPARPVKLVIPFPPGGATDAVGRIVAQQLSAMWKQPVVSDNKPGAGTIIGTDAVAKAAPDGYTLGMVISAHNINPSLRSRLPYDTVKDLSGVSHVGIQHMCIAANPAVEANNIPELIALAKRPGQQLSYASPGSGTAMHLAMELFNVNAGVKITHVPYKGGAPAQQDVVGGQVPLIVDVYHSIAPLMKAGRLKPIAMLSPRRLPALPNVQTVSETIPQVVALSIVGVVAPAGTPRAIINKASTDIAAMLKTPAIAAQFAEMGIEPVGSTPEAYDALIASEIAKWGPVVKASGATVD
jgi:tripartite-type tricarboxylate transporter receptor subunit TctC